jgi:hypothetical protein
MEHIRLQIIMEKQEVDGRKLKNFTRVAVEVYRRQVREFHRCGYYQRDAKKHPSHSKFRKEL